MDAALCDGAEAALAVAESTGLSSVIDAAQANVDTYCGGCEEMLPSIVAMIFMLILQFFMK